MEKKKTILVTGATGLMGKGFEETSSVQYQIVGLHMRDYVVKGAQSGHRVLDIRNQDLINKLFAEHEFDTVIHGAGVASVDYAQTHYAESLESNLIGTLNITAACRRKGVHLVYVSTNAVFDGTEAPYAEDHAVNPVNKYGQIKVQCEKLVTETLENYTIVRPILMYGWNHPACRQNPATWILEKLRAGEKIRLVTDVSENPLYNRQCGEALWEIVKKKPRGVMHLAGGEVVNRYEFGVRLAKIFGLDKSLIAPVDSSFFPTIAPRPKNTTFTTRRMESELGIRPSTVNQGLEQMKAHVR
jgi:dTDP-4-dehydrorhamnose reductase